jgi:hypothetical protein
MTRDNAQGLVVLAGAGVAAWLIYQIYQQVKVPVAAAGAAANAAGNAIANLFPGTQASVVPQGSVALPNGSVVPVSSLNNQGFQSDGTLLMSDGVNSYIISSGATPGTYTAQYSGIGGLRKAGMR